MVNYQKLFGSKDYLKEVYQDTDIGNKLTDSQYKEYIFDLNNSSPVDIKIDTNQTFPVITVSRGRVPFLARLFKRLPVYKQELTFKIFSDYDAYYPHYSNLEVLLAKFLENDVRYAKTVGNSVDLQYKYIQIFSTTNLDLLPELKYWIHFQFTRDVTRWIRFKRIFQSIALNIHPRVIDTVKWRLFSYLAEQRGKYVIDPTNGQEMITVSTDVNDLHALMDLMVYLPYGYLFMVYKSLDVTGTFAESLMLPHPQDTETSPIITPSSSDTSALATPEDIAY